MIASGPIPTDLSALLGEWGVDFSEVGEGLQDTRRIGCFKA